MLDQKQQESYAALAIVWVLVLCLAALMVAGTIWLIGELL